MSAFMCTAPSGIIVYLPNGQQSKIAGPGDTVENTRLQQFNSNPNPGAVGLPVNVSGAAAAVPNTSGFVSYSPAQPPAIVNPNLLLPVQPAWVPQSGQNCPGGITTFPGVTSASIIAATPGLQAQINAGTVIVLQA